MSDGRCLYWHDQQNIQKMNATYHLVNKNEKDFITDPKPWCKQDFTSKTNNVDAFFNGDEVDFFFHPFTCSYCKEQFLKKHTFHLPIRKR